MRFAVAMILKVVYLVQQHLVLAVGSRLVWRVDGLRLAFSHGDPAMPTGNNPQRHYYIYVHQERLLAVLRWAGGYGMGEAAHFLMNLFGYRLHKDGVSEPAMEYASQLWGKPKWVHFLINSFGFTLVRMCGGFLIDSPARYHLILSPARLPFFRCTVLQKHCFGVKVLGLWDRLIPEAKRRFVVYDPSVRDSCSGAEGGG